MSDKTQSIGISYKWAAGVLVVAGFGFLIYGYYSFGLTIENYNEFGDYVGGVVGSFWALASLLLIYVAFLGQQEQIRIQLKELKITQGELRGQKEQFVLQNRNLEKQNFESTLFSMFSIHRGLEGELGKAWGTTMNSGQDVIDSVVGNIEHDLNEALLSDPDFEWRSSGAFYILDKHIVHSFKGRTQLFENFEVIFEFIEKNKNSFFYHKLFAAQLSSSEKNLIVYYLYRHNSMLLYKYFYNGYVQNPHVDDPSQQNIWVVRFVKYIIEINNG